MNSFGKVFRISIFGESHGEAVGIVIDGCPAGLKLEEVPLKEELAKREGGKKGTTARVEKDEPEIISGVFEGKTTGGPIMIQFSNDDTDSVEYKRLKNTPRPGHADFAAQKKFGGFNDYRGGGAFSGRLTVGLVAAGAFAKKLISPISINAKIMEIGGETDFSGAISKAMEDQDSVGGTIKCTVTGVPFGLGEPFFDSVESLISHGVFSIPGVKGIEFGAGFESAKMRGSLFNDLFIDGSGKTRSNNSGGINGGITNSNDIVFKIAVRPAASIGKKQKTIDIKSGDQREIEIQGRHDPCIALRIPVILEAVTAIVIADFMFRENIIERVYK